MKDNITRYRSIQGLPSLFLDLLRFSAAITVLIVHIWDIWVPGAKHDPTIPGDFAHAAVVVFFVLSGYVISFTTFNKDRGALQYAISRLGRLYSVVFPGLIITLIATLFIYMFDPVLFADLDRGSPVLRYLLTGAFLNEIWFLSAVPPVNGPLWSLSYEFWYYAIFGAYFYTKNSKLKWLTVVACLIAGPKILLMMPIWIMGVFAYTYKRPNFKPLTAWLLILVVLIFGFLTIKYMTPLPYKLGKPPLFWASQFITDFTVGIFVGLALWLLPEGNPDFNLISKRAIKVFREVTDLTFPIYVLHMPLIFLFIALFGRATTTKSIVLTGAGIFLFTAFIGYFLNKSKGHYNTFFAWVFKIIKEKFFAGRV